MSIRKSTLHKRSKVIDALTHKPAIPLASDMKHGEIAMHYKEGYERLYIKNDQGNIATFKADDEFYEGYNVVATLTNLPTDKENILATVPQTTQDFSLSNSLEDGKSMHIIVEAEQGTVVRFPEDDDSIRIVGDDNIFKINKGHIGEIDVKSMNGQMYITVLIKPYDSWFVGVTLDGNAFQYKLNGTTTSSAESNAKQTMTTYITSAEDMFYQCENLVSLDLSNFDTSNVTNMREMFNVCDNLSILNISNFDTSNVTDMGGMFGDCMTLKALDLSNFDTSKVTNMSGMFSNCTALEYLNISSFDTSNVTDMSQTFNACGEFTLRYIEMCLNFFKTTQPISFEYIINLGLNEDDTDNGWLYHLVSVAPHITDGQSRVIVLPANLKSAAWAPTLINTLQSKGYTIA